MRAVLLAAALLATSWLQADVEYSPPVNAPVIDGFRLDDGPFGPGNRGIEYATTSGAPVRAIADGQVRFAGSVAGQVYVTVAHPDGLRSSYALRTALVTVDQSIARGEVVGTAGPRFHLGVRHGDRYVDPTTLFAVRVAVPHLISDAEFEALPR